MGGLVQGAQRALFTWQVLWKAGLHRDYGTESLQVASLAWQQWDQVYHTAVKASRSQVERAEAAVSELQAGSRELRGL